MRDPLSKKITGIAPSGIRKFFDIVSEMPDAISLGVGEPDFDTPWRVREEGIYTLEKGRTFYTSNAGLKELRQEISNYLDRKIHVRYDYVHEVMVTVGGSEGIDLTMRAMLNPGDEVLVPEPSYVSYAPCVALADGVPVPIPMKEENEFKLTAEELEAAITPKTKILVLPFPNNPTGAVYSREQLKIWVDFANETGSLIIFDSAYEAFISGDYPHSIYEIEGADSCAVEICSFSKTAGFTGTRCAWSVFPDELTVGDTKLSALWARRQATKFNGVPYIVQRAAEAVLTDEGIKECKALVEYYMENARIIGGALKNSGIEFVGGQNSPYLWLKCPGGAGSWEFFDYLLKNAQLVGTPGAGFGEAGEGYFRLTSFGSRENTLEAAKRIDALFGKN